MAGYTHYPFQSCDPCGSESIMGEQQKDHRYLCKDPITFADPGPSDFLAVHIPLLYSSQQHGFSMPVYQGTLPPSKVLLSLAISVNPVCLQSSSTPLACSFITFSPPTKQLYLFCICILCFLAQINT